MCRSTCTAMRCLCPTAKTKLYLARSQRLVQPHTSTSSSRARPLRFNMVRRAHRRAAFVQPIRLNLSRVGTGIPSNSSRTAVTHRRTSRMSASEHDLLVVGAGHLGSRIAQQWRRLHPSATITGETKTETSHDALRHIGVTPVLAGASSATFPNVVFCVPPRGDPAYSDVVARAAKRASRRFLFTSSTSVHGGVEFINEDTPTSDKGRAAFLHHAENAALQYSASFVVRLAGLYLIDRGPHTFWLSKQVVSGSEKSLINLVHYDDAAAAMVCALRLSQVPERRKFLIAAPEAVTRRQIVECALKHPRFKGVAVPEFLNDEPFVEKRVDGSWSSRVLGWRPLYSSFAQFMELDAQRVAAPNSVNT